MKKLLGTILCLCMLISIMPSNVFATNITIFNVTVKEPKFGEKLSYEASVPETASTYVTKVEWSGTLDALGNAKSGKYTVRVTVRIKDGMDDKYIKEPTKDTVKVNGNSATIGEITADKKQAVISYTFTVSRHHQDVEGEKLLTSGSIMEAVRAAALAVGSQDQIFAEEPQELRDVIPFTLTEPVGGVKHDGMVTTSHPDIKITKITWEGDVDASGTYITGNEYSMVVAFEIKGNVNKNLAETIKYKTATVNGEEIVYNVSQKSDRAGYITQTFVAKSPKAVVDITKVLTQAQADERLFTVNPMYPTELIVTQEKTLFDLLLGEYNVNYNVNLEELYCVKKLVINRSYDSASQLESDAYCVLSFPFLEELWFDPEVDVEKFLDAYGDAVGGYDLSGWNMAFDASNLDTRKVTLLVPDSNYTTFENMKLQHNIHKRFDTKLYSGNLMDAYAKGKSAGYDWCTEHDYSDDIYTPDRVYIMKSCTELVRFYYSCSKCGKCEYDPNHTLLVNPNFTYHWDRMTADSCITERNLSDKYFLGINSRGERVYWKSCTMCGRIHNDHLGPSEGMALDVHALEDSTLKEDSVYAFAVRNDRYVTAKMSEWAQNEVQWASQNGILDLNLLGNDFTKPITRLQFASIAVKLAETLIGTEIVPASKGTFVDTDNEYVLKAYSAGITTGVSATEFNPNGTLTRQQMATFIYRALMYVRDNTTIRYTTYTPALEKYADNGAIQDWARTSLGFMNALGLVKGVSDTAISPDGTCTIEQAALVANRSVNADEIGWYQVPLSTEVRFVAVGGGSDNYYYAPEYKFPTMTRYRNGERIWVDTPTSGGQKASENADVTVARDYLITVEPFTGTRAYVKKEFFRPIKELKDTDAAEYNQYYN